MLTGENPDIDFTHDDRAIASLLRFSKLERALGQIVNSEAGSCQAVRGEGARQACRERWRVQPAPSSLR